MKQDQLKRMYGIIPESFKRRVAFALKKTEEQSMTRKFRVRTVLIAAAASVLLMAAAYAAFSSQVIDFFGRLYGSDMQAWLEKGDVAVLNRSFTLEGVTFTLEEVVYRDNGLYGVGTICPAADSSAIIIPEDHMLTDPYGYDVYGTGGWPEEAPADASTIADVVKEKGGKLFVVRALPDQVGVDGGAMLTIPSVGYAQVPQRDGSIRFSFELSDAYAVQQGKTYTIQLWASALEMNTDGELVEDARHGENWTVEIIPTPMGGTK